METGGRIGFARLPQELGKVICMRSWFLCLSVIVLSSALRAAAAVDDPAEEKPTTVRYGERPLKGTDFLAPVPNERPVENPRAEAYSHTEVQFTFNYRATRRGGKFRAQLKDIQFFSIFVCEKSWNALPNDSQLLDHHEGHFDITQIATLQLQIAWREKTAQEKMVGEGKDEQSAVGDLEKKIKEELHGLDATLQREHQYFDEGTRYGTDPEKEMVARKRQKKRLAELNEELSSEGGSESR